MPTVVRVVTVALDQPAGVVEHLAAGLPPEERQGSPAAVVARAAARELLAAVTGVPAGELEITRKCGHCGHPSHGKPSLVRSPETSFSVSHSGAVGLVAMATGAVVGVDVERLRERARLDALAAKCFSAGEIAAWQDAPAAERLERFVRAWTAKEAYLKATGVGITTKLAEVPVDPRGWSMRALVAPAGYVATLAVDREDAVVEQTSWAPPVSESAGTGR